MREFPAATPVEQARRRVLSVSSLNRRIKDLLESGYPQVWVEGEISNLSRPGSGHVYFSLKDGQSQIRCALFRGRSQSVTTDLVDGAQILVRAKLTMYESRGDTQLVVQTIEAAGEGALRRAFELLKRKLQEEGLFDEGHKQSLPAFPDRVGIITSPTGSAIRDIVATFKRRFPAIPLLIYPISVQGDHAVDDIREALSLASRYHGCKVLILARGGGSLEDMEAFNDERSARAVFECRVPVVCGVGHETDITICDLVADRRAPTPTAAAELVAPNAPEWLEVVAQTERRLIRLMTSRLEQVSQRVDWLGRLIAHPRQQLRTRADRLQATFNTLAGGMRANLQERNLAMFPLPARLIQSRPAARLMSLRNRIALTDERIHQAAKTNSTHRHQYLERMVSRLNSVNPLAVLARGYAMVTDARSLAIVKSIDQAQVDAEVDVRISDGSLLCAVKEKRPGD
ncbi:MAG: Exodeoxyribonuclease 7 large subunit [Gammaproteobacteria bacterium]|nr:Exodeoxyribonuclease 7 large subunit [Gammaproteobacteria bacterium]